MTGNGTINNVSPHVSTSKGSVNRKPLGGVSQPEGVALLVSDTGRSDFSSPLHPQLTVGTTATSLHDLIKNEYANLTAAQRTAFGFTTANDLPKAIIAKRGFLFKADVANANTIYLGTSHVSATALIVGFPLLPGDSLFIEITDSKALYFDADGAGQELYWLAL